MPRVSPGVLGRGPPWACSPLCLGQRAREGRPRGHCRPPLEAPPSWGALGAQACKLDTGLHPWGPSHSPSQWNSGLQVSLPAWRTDRAEGPVTAQSPSEQGLPPNARLTAEPVSQRRASSWSGHAPCPSERQTLSSRRPGTRQGWGRPCLCREEASRWSSVEEPSFSWFVIFSSGVGAAAPQWHSRTLNPAGRLPGAPEARDHADTLPPPEKCRVFFLPL